MHRRGARVPHADVLGARPSLRTGHDRGPPARIDASVRGPPRRRTVLAATDVAVPPERDPHTRRRAAADPLRVVPRRSTARTSVVAGVRSRRAGARRRRALRPRAAHARPATRRVAAPAALRRRPGLRRRLLTGRPGEGAATSWPPGRRRSHAQSRRRRRLRGVHLVVPRGLVARGRAVDPVGGAQRHDLRRPRHDRRLEHVGVMGRGDPPAAVVARPRRRRADVLLGVPAPREPLTRRDPHRGHAPPVPRARRCLRRS